MRRRLSLMRLTTKLHQAVVFGISCPQNLCLPVGRFRNVNPPSPSHRLSKASGTEVPWGCELYHQVTAPSFIVSLGIWTFSTKTSGSLGTTQTSFAGFAMLTALAMFGPISRRAGGDEVTSNRNQVASAGAPFDLQRFSPRQTNSNAMP